jgi:exosome complex component RRP4
LAVYFQKREVVVPGQLLAEGRYRPSYGTYDENGKIYSTLVGLAELRGNTVKVVALEGAYIPKEGDLVIGIITIVAGNNWKVDIGGPYGASLHANNALRRPYSDDISEYMDIGDVISAEVIAFDRQSGPFLSMKGRGLRVLDKGMLFDVSPAKIPRIIGRRGSMINMITDHLKIQTVVGQNGRIWIKAPDTTSLRLAIKAFKTIEAQAHTSNLTERINTMLAAEVAELRSAVPTKETGRETKSEVDEEEAAAIEQSASIDDEVTEVVDDSQEPEQEMDELLDDESEPTDSDDIEDELDDTNENEEVNE